MVTMSEVRLPGLRFQERFYEILQGEHRSSAAKGIGID